MPGSPQRPVDLDLRSDGLNTLPTLSPKAVSFYRSSTGDEVDSLTQWSVTRSLQSVTLTTRTFDYKNPTAHSNPKEKSVPGNQGALPSQLEVYEYTGSYTYSRFLRSVCASPSRWCRQYR